MRRGFHGFTLIELMITVAVLGILATLAAPGFANFVRDRRATTQANELVSAMNYARSEAIKRSARVALCKSTNPLDPNNASCDTGAADWSQGWLVFVDDNTDGDYDSANETLLRAHGAVEQSTLTAANGSDWVGFTEAGLAAQDDDFTLDPDGCTGKQERSIDMSPTGRAEVTATSC